MNERSRLQGVTNWLRSHIAFSHLVQFAVRQRHQQIWSWLFTVAVASEQLADLMR